MNKEANAHHTLIVLLLLGCAIHTAALPSTNSPPANDTTPPSLDGSSEDGSQFLNFKIAKPEEAAATGLRIVWTIADPQKSQGTCTLTGFYDSDKLDTEAKVKSCFTDLGTLITIGKNGGQIYYTDQYYWPEAYPYCAINCVLSTGRSAASSIQMSFGPLLLALLFIISLNYF